MHQKLSLEESFKGKIVAGADEVGRGALAGPLVATAVIIDRENIIEGVKDSKKLTPAAREMIYNKLIYSCIYGIGIVSVEEIDEMNIGEANKLGIERAVKQLSYTPDIVLVDGIMKFNDTSYVSIKKGDENCYSIAAASIIAKVYRDNLMKEYESNYLEYKWYKNKGYGTKEHIFTIKQLGYTKHHRKTFYLKSVTPFAYPVSPKY